MFDLVTFAILLGPFAAGALVFRSGWFVESLLTELMVALVVRTRGSVLRSRPGRVLLWTTLALLPLTLAIPYLPAAGVLGFVPIPMILLGVLVALAVAYVAAAEWLKRVYYAPRAPHLP